MALLFGGWWIWRQQPNNPRKVDEIVLARADGLPVNTYRFKVTYIDYLIRSGKNDTHRNRTEHLNNLIDTYLLGQEGKRRGYEPDSVYISYRNLERKIALGRRFYETTFLDTLALPAEIAAQAALIHQNEKVKLRHLLYAAEEDAQQAYAALQGGAYFSDLANTAVYDSTAGYLGPVMYWQLDDSLAHAAFSLAPGTYSVPVHSKYGWHILLVEERISAPVAVEADPSLWTASRENLVWARRPPRSVRKSVHAFKNSLNMQVNHDALRALRDAVRDRINAIDINLEEVLYLPDEAIHFVREPIQPGLILANYRLNGNLYSFTAEDYIFWLRTLPAWEVYHNTDQSLDRALQKEIFAQEGIALGLENDPLYRESMRHTRAVYLANLVQSEARARNQLLPTELVQSLRASYSVEVDSLQFEEVIL